MQNQGKHQAARVARSQASKLAQRHGVETWLMH